MSNRPFAVIRRFAAVVAVAILASCENPSIEPFQVHGPTTHFTFESGRSHRLEDQIPDTEFTFRIVATDAQGRAVSDFAESAPALEIPDGFRLISLSPFHAGVATGIGRFDSDGDYSLSAWLGYITGRSNRFRVRGARADRMGFTLSSPVPPMAQLRRALGMGRAAGAGWARITVNTSVINPRDGIFKWSTLDSTIAAARDHDLNVLLLLFNTPDWNAAAPADALAPRPECAPARWAKYPPRDYEKWGAYVRQVAERYAKDVGAWEIWNEPDVDGMMKPTDACREEFWCGTPSDYAHLLTTASAAIRQVDSAATISFAGLAYVGRGNRNFFHDVLADSTYPVRNAFDVVGFHQYGPVAAVVDRFQEFRGKVAAEGLGTRPIWVTEIGAPSAGAGVTPDTQAQYLDDLMDSLTQSGAEKVFWYELSDPAPAKCRVPAQLPSYGVLTDSLQPKPSLARFSAVAAKRLR